LRQLGQVRLRIFLETGFAVVAAEGDEFAFMQCRLGAVGELAGDGADSVNGNGARVGGSGGGRADIDVHALVADLGLQLFDLRLPLRDLAFVHPRFGEGLRCLRSDLALPKI
jgi:hypothetical protein